MKSSLCMLVTFVLLSLAKTSSSQFVNHFLDSKRGDTVKRLDQIRQYFVMYGYLSIDKKDDNSESFDYALEEAIKKFQTFYHLDISGVLDEKTLALINMTRCGVPDYASGISSRDRKIPLGQSSFNGSYYEIGNSKWPKYNLEWTVRFGARLDATAEIAKAIKSWQSVSPFRFRNIRNYKRAEIKIGFYRRDHGDSEPFDGPGKVLAHSMLPPYGLLHFDADENWVVGAQPKGMDIESVGLHELGHILGLEHSQIESAVMYPYLSYGVVKNKLTKDDIDGLKALYHFS